MLYSNKIYSLLVLVIITLIFSGCRKDIELPDPQLQELFGEWEWIRSNPGDGGPFLYPATGNTVIVEFNKNGIYKEHKNGKLELKDKFTLHEDRQHSAQPYYYIDLENMGKARLIIEKDTLILLYSYWCFDCGESWYVRK